MKKLVSTNEHGSLYQIKENTPRFNTAKLISSSLGTVDNYLTRWFLRKSAEQEFTMEPTR